uniref:Eukaryotic translation initiation factor 4E family member 1B n=1 Tax=Equus caballus TaxID=9796 RepID=A0A9L0RE31_HORSE
MPGKHQHFQEPEVGCCGKYFLFGFNIVFWVSAGWVLGPVLAVAGEGGSVPSYGETTPASRAWDRAPIPPAHPRTTHENYREARIAGGWHGVLGALFLAIGLWAWGEKGVLSNLSALTDLGGLDPVWLFVVVGGIMSVLGFAGCIGALRENTFLLKFFSVFLGLIFFLELATGILAFVFKDWIRDQLNLFINNNVKAYRDDIDLQNLIDFAQEYWSCCGARGPNDWNLNIYFNCTDLNPSRERCGVPFSCCVRDPAEDVLNTQCGYDVRLKLELEQQGSIHTKGCVGQFEKWLQDNLIVVAGVFVGIALLQIFGICLAQNLVSDIKAVKANCRDLDPARSPLWPQRLRF